MTKTILPFVFSAGIFLSSLSPSAEKTYELRRKCTGSDYCTACTNCSGCAHCNSGGRCGVCNPKSVKKISTTTKGNKKIRKNN